MTKPDQQSERRRIANLKKQARESLLDYYPDIVVAVAKQALDGSVPHAKLCFELLDAVSRKARDDEEDEEAPSLAEYLIEQLQLEPPRSGDGPQAETV